VKDKLKTWAVYLPLVAIIFEGLRVALEALDGYLARGQKGVLGAAIVVVTALGAWLAGKQVKRDGDIAPDELDDVVKQRLNELGQTPPDEPGDYQ
jgi:hypothetical protein